MPLLPNFRVDLRGVVKSSIAGIVAIFVAMSFVIIVLIINKQSFSENLFLIVFLFMLFAAAVAAIYIFCYGICTDIVKLVNIKQQLTWELKGPDRNTKKTAL